MYGLLSFTVVNFLVSVVGLRLLVIGRSQLLIVVFDCCESVVVSVDR